MVSPRERESASEHVRNAMALVSVTLQVEERQSRPEGLSVLVPVTTLEAIQRRLEAALLQLEPKREV